jgi:hypothetical protein
MTPTFHYCSSLETVVFAGKGNIRCREGQEMTADGQVSDTFVDEGNEHAARVQASSYSCK